MCQSPRGRLLRTGWRGRTAVLVLVVPPRYPGGREAQTHPSCRAPVPERIGGTGSAEWRSGSGWVRPPVRGPSSLSLRPGGRYRSRGFLPGRPGPVARMVVGVDYGVAVPAGPDCRKAPFSTAPIADAQRPPVFLPQGPPGAGSGADCCGRSLVRYLGVSPATRAAGKRKHAAARARSGPGGSGGHTGAGCCGRLARGAHHLSAVCCGAPLPRRAKSANPLLPRARTGPRPDLGVKNRGPAEQMINGAQERRKRRPEIIDQTGPDLAPR